MATAKTYAQVRDAIELKLQDTSNAEFSTTEIDAELEDTIAEVSAAYLHIVEVAFEIESRFGSASSTSSNNLVDSDKAQFLTADANKNVYNDNDKTYAVITSHSSSSQVGLSADIFTVGEAYYIYNRRCQNSRQFYIGGMFGHDLIIRAEYPVNTLPQSGIRHWRNVTKINEEVAEVDFDFTPDDSDASQTSSFTRVLFQVTKPHVLCQLADLLGAVHTTATVGAVSMQVKSFTDAEVAEVGDEFHIAGHSATYVVTAELTLANQASTGSTLAFLPALEAAAAAALVITFTKSTLTPTLEDLVIRRCFARLVRFHGAKFLTRIPFGGANVFGNFRQLGRDIWDETEKDLAKAPPKTSRIYSKGGHAVGIFAHHGHDGHF